MIYLHSSHFFCVVKYVNKMFFFILSQTIFNFYPKFIAKSFVHYIDIYIKKIQRNRKFNVYCLLSFLLTFEKFIDGIKGK